MMKHRSICNILIILFLFITVVPVLAQTATPPPIPTATPLPAPTVVATAIPFVPGVCSEPLALVVGSIIYTRPGINIRNLPTISGAIVQYLDQSITYRVTGDSVCADGVNWWPIRGPIGYNPGWVAEKESSLGRYLIFPAEPLGPQCAEPLSLPIGQRVPLSNGGIRVRSEPSLNGQVLTVALIDTPVTIIGLPVCADDYNWWPVEVINVGITYVGWMAEGFAGQPWVVELGLPSEAAGTLCAPPLNIGEGTRAYVGYRDDDPKSLRVAPGKNSELLYTLVEGIAFTVIGGPICADNLNWWQIQIISRPDVTGWLAEGGPGNYWIRRFEAIELR